MYIVCVTEHNIHCDSTSYKFSLVGKLVVQFGIRAMFGGGSCVRTTHCLFISQFIKPTCKSHQKEAIYMHVGTVLEGIIDIVNANFIDFNL